jgi:tetratricopeptide (TPR) repeat protein
MGLPKGMHRINPILGVAVPRVIILKALTLLMAVMCLPEKGTASSKEDPEIAHYRRLVASKPSNIQVNVTYQDLVLKSNPSERATLQNEYEKKLKSRGANAANLYLYGRILTDPDERLGYLLRAVKADATLYQARVDLGRAYYHAGDYDTAISHYKSALNLRPSSGFTRNLLGLAYYYKGYVDQATAEYRKAIELNDRYIDAYLNLGLTYLYTDRAVQAIHVYEQALTVETDGSEKRYVYRNLGMALAQMERIDDAKAAYRKALELDPTYSDAYISLGNLAFNSGDYKNAGGLYEKALENSSESGELQLKLGLSSFNQKNFKKGIVHLQQAVKLDSTQTDAYYYLGLACFNDGQNALAMDALEKYVSQEHRYSKNATVFKAKQLIGDLKRIKIREIY